ncbi:M14 family zinc carboxypeptidase [Halomicrococcus sp. NG-SE-24]|uniref:M14 family zinc carboxypeptidase n=1 Tax=Halomicrococcus sp. NG-SE-24 TaxID=3436928 RepID=UPI003D98DF83
MVESDPANEATETDADDRFRDSSIDRRTFMRLSAATTGTALAFPGNASAGVSAAAMTTEYEYVINHTPDDYAVPTLVEFSSASGLDAISSIASDAKTTTTPKPAAYAQLTTTQAQSTADLPTAETLSVSPGSNPFWRLGYYPLGVFPEPKRAVDFISYEQMKDGIRHLEREHPTKMNVTGIGQSPGHYNNITTRDDPKGMFVAEVTNNVGDKQSFQEKEKVFYSLSLHGLERAGAEAGARIVENILRGDDKAGEIPSLLDDIVLVFGFTNPDGWVARNPQYDSGHQTGGPGASHPRIPAAPLYERGNAEIYDTNRQYPTVGYITPAYYPAEPRNPADRSKERVTDALAIVEHFRNYENLNYGADLHGGPVFNEFVLGLISQDQYDTREMHEVYEMCRAIDTVLEEELSVWSTAGDAKLAVLGEQQIDPVLFGIAPEEAFDYATIYDTIDYTVSGAMLDWMSHPEDLGGLGMTTLDFEMAFSHLTGGNVYNPELLDMEVRGYRTAIRTITKFAVENSDTPNTSDQFSATTKTRFDASADPQRVAYVTTGTVGTSEDALRRHSGALEFDGSNQTQSSTEGVIVGLSTASVTEAVSASNLHSLAVHTHSQQAMFDLKLISPSDEVVRSHDTVTDERAGGKCCGHPQWVVSDPEPGEWTVEISNVHEDASGYEVRFNTLASSGTNPDPMPAVGYDQYEYDVTPLRFFEDYADSITDDGVMEPVTVAEVANGALADYDHAVISHDYGANADASYLGGSVPGYTSADHPAAGYDVSGYVAALDSSVNDGGNLVLTDMGVNLLESMDNNLIGSDRFTSGDFTTDTYDVARYTEKNSDHPLLTDVRPIQEQLWKVAPLGYAVTGEAPMRLLDEGAFTGASAEPGDDLGDGIPSIAARTDGFVATGSLTQSADDGTGVHVVSSLVPPPTQKNLHPFGLLNYTPTFLGYLVLTSAFGFQQVRRTADDAGGKTYGAGPDFSVNATAPEAPGQTFTAGGTRADDGSVFTGGQTNQVEITVSSLSHDATITDSVPDGWTVKDGYGDVTAVDGNIVELGTVSADEVADSAVTRTYFVEAPSEVTETGRDTFGPAVATVVDPSRVEKSEDQVAGTDTNTVLGASTNT